MKKTILEIYALAVCFVSVVCFIVSVGFALYSILAIMKPDFTINPWEYNQYQTNDAYWNSSEGGGFPPPIMGPGGEVVQQEKKIRPTELELTKQREASYARVLSAEQRHESQTLAKSLIIILINTVIFSFHWLIARHARESTP